MKGEVPDYEKRLETVSSLTARCLDTSESIGFCQEDTGRIAADLQSVHLVRPKGKFTEGQC